MSSGALPVSRCLKRGLAVLGELNRRHVASAAEIGAAIDVPRPTVHRLLLALAADGYVRRIGASEFFMPQQRVTELSAGWNVQARAIDLGARMIDDLGERVAWPVDLTVFDNDAMVVRHSTHDNAAWSLLPNSPVGHRIPLCGTAPGRMFLAGLDPGVRAPFLAGSVSEQQAVDLAERRGFAFRDGGVVPRTTSIAVAVKSDTSTVLCLSMAFIRASTVLGDAITEHVPILTAIARDVEATL